MSEKKKCLKKLVLKKKKTFLLQKENFPYMGESNKKNKQRNGAIPLHGVTRGGRDNLIYLTILE